MSVIQINHLTKDYGRGKGVFDLSFEVPQGEVFGFLEPNGAGKTTTIRHLLGFIKPENGETSINGLDCWSHSSELQRNLGYLPGEISLPDNMTGTQYIEWISEMRKMKDKHKIKELTDMFELDTSGVLKRMSKGMKQKIGIVCAFMHDPQTHILDEPTSGLDPLMQATFIELIAAEKRKGKTILMSSHMFEEVENTCDRVAIIKEGRLMETISPDEIRHAHEKVFKVEFVSSADCQKFSQENFEFSNVLLEKNQVVIKIQDENINSLLRTLAGYDVKFISEIKQTLEDFFMRYYQGQGGKK